MERGFLDEQTPPFIEPPCPAPFSYNFLMTRRWMLVVPRRREKFAYATAPGPCGCACPCPCPAGCPCACSCTTARGREGSPRDWDECAAFPFNSLAFGGFLFLPGDAALPVLTRLTPHAVLAALTYPAADEDEGLRVHAGS